jgi:hypothetical protein
LGVSCRLVLLNLKNFEELIPMIMNVLRGFILQFFKLETSLNTSQGKFIANFVNQANETNYLFIS